MMQDTGRSLLNHLMHEESPLVHQSAVLITQRPDNFDDRLKAMKPRAAFAVPNTITGEGDLKVDITFDSMDDFSPAAVARKVDGLNKLLETRTQLANLVTYMDGKAGAEELISKALSDPTLLQSVGQRLATLLQEHFRQVESSHGRVLNWEEPQKMVYDEPQTEHQQVADDKQW